MMRLLVFGMLIVPFSITARSAESIHKEERAPIATDSGVRINLLAADSRVSIVAGEPLFLTIQFQNTNAAQGRLSLPGLGFRGNPWMWQTSRDGATYNEVGVNNVARLGVDSGRMTKDFATSSDRYATIWFRAGHPRPLVFNEKGIWYIRVLLRVKKENQSDQYVTITSESLQIEVMESSNELLNKFTKELGNALGDDLLLNSTARDRILSTAIDSEDPLVKQYARWLLIRSYLGDPNWFDALEDGQPKAIDKLNELADTAKEITTDQNKETPLYFDAIAVQAWDALLTNRFHDAAKLIRDIPLTYETYWTDRLHEWLNEEYMPTEQVETINEH